MSARDDTMASPEHVDPMLSSPFSGILAGTNYAVSTVRRRRSSDDSPRACVAEPIRVGRPVKGGRLFGLFLAAVQAQLPGSVREQVQVDLVRVDLLATDAKGASHVDFTFHSTSEEMPKTPVLQE